MNDITKAVDMLRQGGLVAVPTETVYGLGADASNVDALKKIFAAKGRPSDHPLIVHLADLSQLSAWARDISAAALVLAKTFWPGPLTLILKKSPGVNDLITGGQDTIGLRIPNHPVALALLKQFGGGIAAPSANRFGRISPTTADAVREELGDSVDCVLEGGQCIVGVESTIVDMSGDFPVVLRPGMISAGQIEAVLHQTVMQQQKNSPRVSGSLESHYAPETKTHLLTRGEIQKYVTTALEKDKPFAVVVLTAMGEQPGIIIKNMPCLAEEYAHDLYKILRELDKMQLKQILIESVPEHAEWDAVRDRLQRACS
jgi:L-threonylcarbamoyladenylate synthase